MNFFNFISLSLRDAVNNLGRMPDYSDYDMMHTTSIIQATGETDTFRYRVIHLDIMPYRFIVVLDRE